jgi:hypothetical protein
MTSRLTFTPGSHVYKLDGQRVPSVTQLLKQLDKPALTRWAANTAADYATDHWTDLAHLPPSERRKQIAAAPWANRDRAAAAGTAIHAMAEQLLAGEPAEVPDSLTSKVQGLARWIETSAISIVASEIRVWSEGDDDLGLIAYAGTLDAIVKHPRYGLGIIDWKTGSGIYAEAGLQLAGYRAAEMMVTEGEDHRMVTVQWLGAVHIQSDLSELHILPDDQLQPAADRWEALRMLAGTSDPQFRRDLA